MTPAEYQQKAMRTLCDQHQARIHASGAAGPGNEWLDRQPLMYGGELNIGPLPALSSPKFGNGTPNNLIPIQTLHAMIGLAGEVGELTSVIQKWIWYGKAFTLVELQQKVKDEAGDVLWYVAELLTAFGLKMEDVMTANISKLRVRYPEKYKDDLAADEARDRAAEAVAIMQPCPLENPCVAIADEVNAKTMIPPVRVQMPHAPLGPRAVDDVMKARGTDEGCCARNLNDLTYDCLADAATADRQARCPHNGEWSPIVGIAGSGRRCGLCGKTEAF